MEDFFADLYDDDKKDEREPSFSLYEFKKWLAKENRKKKAEKSNNQDDKKEKFKQKIRDKINKKKR